jgi:4-hydroxy-tetrahydrodipicolinate synthase
MILLDNFPLWTAMITPMYSNGSIDFDSLAHLLKEQENAKNGILMLGSTGEGLNLDEQEKKEILNFTLKQNLQVPIMCGVGGINLNSTLSWVEYLNSLNLQAYLMVTPLYAKPMKEGQYHWFKSLLDKSKKPSILYNIPSRTGCSLDLEVVDRLCSHPHFYGVKEASGNLEEFKKYKKVAQEGRIFSGDDALMPLFSKHGAFGLISVSSNIWPRPVRKFVSDCLNSTLLQEDLWQNAFRSLFLGSNPIPVKRLLHQMEKIKSPTLRPPLSEHEIFDFDKLIHANNIITQLSEYDQKKDLI